MFPPQGAAAPQQAGQAASAASPAQPPVAPPQQVIPPAPPPPSWAEVMGVLQNNRLRDFRLDIETDSTIAPDPDAEQQARVQFIEMLAAYLQAALPAAAAGQIPPELAGQIMLFAVRGFPVARELESVLEKWVESLASGTAQIQPPPDPAIALQHKQLGLEQQKIDQGGKQFDATQQFERDKIQQQQQAEAAKLKGPPFVVGQDGAPQGANDLVQGLQQEFEQEMMQVTQALMQFMQAQTQQQQMMMQALQAIVQGLQAPKQKTHQIVRDPSGQVVGARTIEAPAPMPPGVPQ